MIKWLVRLMEKEARRFQRDDSVRYFTQPRKGRGQGIVLTPSFRPGRIVDYDSAMRRYKVWDEGNQEEIMVHPRNLVPNSHSKSVAPAPIDPQPAIDVAAEKPLAAEVQPQEQELAIAE